MANHETNRKLLVVTPVFIAFAFLFIIPSNLGTTNHVYGQPDQMNSNVTNSINIQNIPVKKVHVGDIDIAYKTFGKGDPILLVSPAQADMNAWEPSILIDLSTNHTVIVFDNRGGLFGNNTKKLPTFNMPIIRWTAAFNSSIHIEDMFLN